MKNAEGKILYIGKAGNLRRRVSSYFLRSQDARIQKLVSKIENIDYKKTASALEALILESKLIKKYHPPFNIKEADDKSFLYVDIVKEKFPRVLLSRGKGAFGPFTSASHAREALRIIRRIFPFNTHQFRNHAEHSDIQQSGLYSKPCFDYQVGLCPGTCIGKINQKEYAKTIRNIKFFFNGKQEKILKNLKKEMGIASKNLEFEKALKIKKQIFALQHIQDIALISDVESQLPKINSQTFCRIEGYDISNISGASAVGSMVVFINGKPDKNEYRKFKIRNFAQSNDVGMLKEVLRRRLRHQEWRYPNLFLIDGGKPQVNATKEVFSEFNLKIPVVGIAKGVTRKKNEIIGRIPIGIEEKTLIQIRDEAHRFAVAYHRILRKKILMLY